MDARTAVRQRLTAYFDEAGDESMVRVPKAVHDARTLLAGAFIIDPDGNTGVDGEALALGAWLFWCRWQLSPAGSDDPDLQTAYRLFTVLHTADPDAPIPPEISEAMASEDRQISELMHDEARDLIDACLGWFDDAAGDLGVILARCALAAASDASPEQADYACNLGAGLFARYRHHAAEEDLDEAVVQFRFASASGHGDTTERARYLANLGVALHTRFQRGVREADIAEAVHAHRQAIKLQPEAENYRTQYAAVLSTRYEFCGHVRDLDRALRYAISAEPLAVTNLAEMLHRRYERCRDVGALQESARLLTEVVRETPAGDPDEARRLASLAATLVLRFAATDDLDDLDHAVAVHERAVAAAHADDPHLVDYLSNFGHALHDRYEERGDIADLQRALAVYDQADGRPGGLDAIRVGNEANAYAARFDRMNDIDDLDRALDAYVAAVESLPSGHIHRGSHLSNLGSMWFVRYNRTEDPADLQHAIELDRESVRITPPRHHDRSRRLANLGAALDSLYESRGDAAVLDEAIDMHREAYQTAIRSQRGHHCAALGTALHLRYHLRGRADDLDEAVTLHREASQCRIDHPDRPRRHTVLASALMTRSADRDEPNDLTEAVDLLRSALAATPPLHVQRVGRLVQLGSALARLAEHTGERRLADEAILLIETVADRQDASSPRNYRMRTLGDAFESRWRVSADLADLRAAVTAYRTAITITGDDEPDQALNHYDLAGVLAALANAPGELATHHEAMAEYRLAGTQTTAPVPLRIHAAVEWAALALALDEPAQSVQGFTLALDLLPQLAWLGLARPERERHLTSWGSLAADAAASALLAGQDGVAAELVDRGRSLLWEQQLRLRDDHSRLDRRRPSLARRLRSASLELSIGDDPRR